MFCFFNHQIRVKSVIPSQDDPIVELTLLNKIKTELFHNNDLSSVTEHRSTNGITANDLLAQIVQFSLLNVLKCNNLIFMALLLKYLINYKLLL